MGEPPGKCGITVRVFFVNDSSSNPNWGDRAAAMALTEMIVERGHEIVDRITEDELRESSFWQPRAPVSVAAPVPFVPSRLRRWAELCVPPAVPRLGQKIRSRLAPAARPPVPERFAEFETAARRIVKDRSRYGHLLDRLQAADCVLIHGDGCIVGNGILPRTELFLAYLCRTHLDLPVALVNHTADLGHPRLAESARAVYPLLDDVRFREEESLERCQDFCKGVYTPDSAFRYVPADGASWRELASRSGFFDVWPDTAHFDPRLPYLCVGGSSIFSFDGRPDKVIDGFCALIRGLPKVYSGQIVLTASDSKDELIFREVAHLLDLPLLGLATPVQQVVDVVGNADLYIGGRWHPSIFALSGGTPVVPITSKTFKIPALVRMAGLPVEVFDAEDLRTLVPEICGAAERLLRMGLQQRMRLRAWAAAQRSKCSDNVAMLGEAMPTSPRRPRPAMEGRG